MDITKKIGQRLVGGFPGKEMSPEFIRLVKKYKISNVILFRHNVESGKQLKSLCESIQRLVKEETGHGAFITIDQEGGVVTRLPEDGCNVPGAMAIAATGNPENARLAARITADELKALGINFNLAPVLDINNNPANPVIGVRSYGDTAEIVEEYGCAALNGYLEGGILAVVKHFPGHGDTTIDSHIGLPVIDKSWEELEELELRPFKAAIAMDVPAVMTSHILFPKLESENIPCTMSRRIITGLLKEKIGFRGLVISDCLEMDAIQKHYGTAKGAVEAMAAGVDILFVSHSAALMEEVVEAIYQAVKDGRIEMEELDASVKKILDLKNQYVENVDSTGIYGSDEAKKKTDYLRRKSIALTQGEIIPLGENPLFAGCKDYRASQVSNRESGQLNFPIYMQERFGGKAMVTDKNPDEKEIKDVLAVARKATSVVLGTYNGHLMPGQMKLLQELAKLSLPMMVVALRNPYDLAGLPAQVTGLCAWDYTEMTLEVLSEVFAGTCVPEGRVPIQL